jgi:hypothetical protein
MAVALVTNCMSVSPCLTFFHLCSCGRFLQLLDLWFAVTGWLPILLFRDRWDVILRGLPWQWLLSCSMTCLGCCFQHNERQVDANQLMLLGPNKLAIMSDVWCHASFRSHLCKAVRTEWIYLLLGQKIPSIMSQAFIFNPLRSMLAFAWDKSGVANVICF